MKDLTPMFFYVLSGSNISNKPGTGHGLTFIKNAIEMHGGMVGYEATQYGNNFYFIIPKSN